MGWRNASPDTAGESIGEPRASWEKGEAVVGAEGRLAACSWR